MPWGWQNYHIDVGDGVLSADANLVPVAECDIRDLDHLCIDVSSDVCSRMQEVGLMIDMTKGSRFKGVFMNRNTVRASLAPTSSQCVDLEDLFKSTSIEAITLWKSNFELRMAFAIVAASTVQQLHNTRWLDAWSQGAVVFPQFHGPHGQPRIYPDQPYLQIPPGVKAGIQSAER